MGTYIFWYYLRGGFPSLFFSKQQKTTDANRRYETATYNLAGLPVSTTDKKGVITTYTYNGYGSPLTVTTQGIEPIEYTYNVNNILLQAKQGKDITTYEYDGLGRLTKETENGSRRGGGKSLPFFIKQSDPFY